jgi:hypothetical protein
MDDDPYAPLARRAVSIPAHEAASPSPRAEEEMEEESLIKEYIDPAYLRLVELVSSPTRPDLHVEGLRILAHLCRRALQRPLPFKKMTQVAECEFAGIATLCRGEEEARYGKWPYSRETTLKWFVLLEALSVIRRFRRKGKTVIQIQLGKREPLSQAQLLHNLNDYASKYTNSKTYELLMRAKADIERYGVPSYDLEEGDVLDQQALQIVQRQLVAKLQESGVSRATSRKVALWLTSGPLAQIAKDYLHAVRAATTVAGKAIPPPHSTSAPACATSGSQFSSQQGDCAKESLISPGRFLGNKEASLEQLVGESAHSLPFPGDFEKSMLAQGAGDRLLHAVQGDSLSQEQARTGRQDIAQGDFASQEYAQSETLLAVSTSRSRLPLAEGDAEQQETREEVVSHTAKGAHSGQRLPKCNLLSVQQGDFQRTESPATTTAPAVGIALFPRQGDSPVALSSSNSISFPKDFTGENEFEFDTAAQHNPPESPSSPAERRAEAMYLWRQLYSDEQRNAQGGQRLIGGLINKLNERPDLVRLAMVNVLLQRFFPDRHGPPDGCGAKWFYRSYARYLNGQLTPSPEITSWAESAYSYQQIERALRAEYAYQQADVFRKPHRPSVSCVVEHQLLESVLAGTVVEAQREQQTTQHSGAPAAGRYDQAEQGREVQEEPVPAHSVCTATQVHEESMEIASPARHQQRETRTQKVVVVQDPQAGWTSLEGVLWWCEQMARTSLATSCRLEVLPTEYGRYVLVVTPHEDEAAAWLWCSGRQVREYLEQWRCARVQTRQSQRPARTPQEQSASPEQTSQMPLPHLQASSPSCSSQGFSLEGSHPTTDDT